MARESIKYTAHLVFTLSVFGMMAAPAAAPGGPPALLLEDTGTVYGQLCGGYASDTCPYFTLNVLVINTSFGVNTSNVTVDVSRWNNTPSGFLVMNSNGTSEPNFYFNLNVTVDKVVRGTYNTTVTAYNNNDVSNTTNLSVEAHMQPGLSVVGYNSSKSYPAYPTFVSMFYNNSPIVMIINTTDATQYTNITVDFSGVDGSTSMEYNNSGVLLPDGTNYTYRITHTLGTIPTNDVRTAWVNATLSTGGGDVIIPQMASLVIVSNINPINMGMGLGGATTNWPDIPDYTNAYLTFEAVNATNGFKVATLTFNDPINLTNRTTAMNLSLLGQKLSIAGSSMSLSGAADALVAFNKSANLTIYNLTNFATSPAIFADGVLIALPDQSSGGAAANISWNQTAQSLTLNVSHWTSYSWGTYGVNLTNISALSSTTISAANATYTFILQNNGTLADTYNLTISNPDTASVAALNISGNITLEANAIQTLQLNVTNTIAGTYYVNVTATSVNFSNRTGSINTTTTVYTTNISSCGTISVAGTYTLTENIINSSVADACIKITSSDVVFDGGGHTIDGNDTGSTYGVYVYKSGSTLTNVTVKNVIVTDWHNGIYYISAANGNLENNNASSNIWGIYLDSSNSTTISGGSVSNGSSGVVVIKSSYVNVTGVEIFTNTVNGLFDDAVGATSYQNFSYNNISGNYYGINMNGEDNSTIKGNRIWNNTYGIYLTASNDNTIYNNNFSNTNNSRDDGNNIWNTTKTLGTNIVGGQYLGGNFWSDYEGTDTDGDGLGNTSLPYNSSGNITNGGDYLPLLAPIVVTITSPGNNSVNDTGYVNVTVTLDRAGTARLNWNGVNESMDGAGTSYYKNKTGLLSGNHSFKIYANDSSYAFRTSVSEARIVTVNRTVVDSTIESYINTTTFIVNTTINITSPDGNVTVTIPNGTNASVGGVALTSISADSLAQVNSTFVANLGSNDKLIGENLSLGPEGAIFSPAIQIQFNYTLEMLTAAGISASELRVKFYNTTTNTWDVQTPYTLNETGKYIIANVSHFSTFALLGTTSTGGGSTGGGSSSGNTGGGGVVTGEAFDNIAKSESYDKDLIADTPVTYTFKNPELGVYEIAFTGKESENGITLRVEALKATSKQVTTQAPGTVYKNINILAGTKRMKEALVRFRVENSWLGSNSLAGSEVKLVKWDGSQWTQLETTQTTKDETYTNFEAKTDTFSVFAITGLKGGIIVPKAPPAGAVTETPGTPAGTGTPAPSPTKKVPAFEFALTVAILSVSYLFGRKRR